MKLRIKTLITLGIIFMVLFILLTTVIQSTILNSFREVEKQSVDRNIQRAVNVFSHEFDSLRKESYDWSTWNDTYTFVEDRNQAYIDANLQDVAFQGIGINIMMFYNTSDDLVFGKNYDPQNVNDTSIPQSLVQEFTEHAWLLHHNSTNSYFQGIVLLPNHILLLASRPILTSSAEGPIHGTLLVGQYLTDKQISEISNLLELPFIIVRLDSIFPADFGIACQSLTENESTFIQTLNETTIAGYSLFNDINDNPVLILRVEQSRYIFQKGIESMWSLIIFLIIITLVICISTMTLLERLVISPLTKLNNHILDISTTKELSKRITLYGNDELTTLAKTTNTLLDTLEKSQQTLLGKINELEHYKRSTIDRELKMIELKKKLEQLSSKQNGGTK
jgi:sensor domain CHASE-containing protein